MKGMQVNPKAASETNRKEGLGENLSPGSSSTGMRKTRVPHQPSVRFQRRRKTVHVGSWVPYAEFRWLAAGNTSAQSLAVEFLSVSEKVEGHLRCLHLLSSSLGPHPHNFLTFFLSLLPAVNSHSESLLLPPTRRVNNHTLKLAPCMIFHPHFLFLFPVRYLVHPARPKPVIQVRCYPCPPSQVNLRGIRQVANKKHPFGHKGRLARVPRHSRKVLDQGNRHHHAEVWI